MMNGNELSADYWKDLRNEYCKDNGCSVASVAQALKRSGCKQRMLFRLMGIRSNKNNAVRYWLGKGLKDWDEREEDERTAAEFVAIALETHYLFMTGK